ncbi:hypothetical protein RN001_014848 [Aquatica leii]|uniref:Glucose-methanol-choline oxidoreductase N-terminal domain-containing protein n=1 Tax=Aquatica leii TaxID=1421715 RepID=A0AAN7SBX1_9COLE|nr:hypothetical protein RN001_014848 [Aquatica leii]
MKLLLMLVLAKCVVADYSSTIEYYDELIKNYTFKAYHYDGAVNAYQYEPIKNNVVDVNATYDFVVIGSGSAGAVVANRLSEIHEWNVLLIEAGGDENNFTDIPRFHLYLQGLEYNWNFNTTEQTGACQGMVKKKCALPRGRILGGTSTINGLVYCRGNKADYDRWNVLGWSYKDVLPYFIKSENSHVDSDSGYHGKGGYWNVEYHKPVSKQLIAFLEANQLLYNTSSTDYNGKQQLGMFQSQINNINGRRDSTAKAFLQPVASRRNLHILRNSYVTKILIDPNSKKTFGVEFAHDHQLKRIKVAKEVILSAGSINSPQLLMLSGVGPKDQLEQHNITLIQDLPVGKTLRDHVGFFGLYVQTNLKEPVQSTDDNIKQYLDGYGPFAIALNSQGVGFYQTKFGNDTTYPDMEFEFMPSNSTSPFLQKSLKVTDETYNALWSKLDSQKSFNIYLIALHPKSVGYLRLKSNNPFEYPLINPKYLTDREGKDIAVLYEGLQILKNLLNTEPMRKINASIVYADYPQCRQFKTDSRDYWYCAFRLLSSYFYHPISTCAIGNDPKQGAVVDKHLKVFGIDGLRVADASIIPATFSGHTSAPAVMIGEKVSDIIKLHYKKPIVSINNTIF